MSKQRGVSTISEYLMYSPAASHIDHISFTLKHDNMHEINDIYTTMLKYLYEVSIMVFKKTYFIGKGNKTGGSGFQKYFCDFDLVFYIKLYKLRKLWLKKYLRLT